MAAGGGGEKGSIEESQLEGIQRELIRADLHVAAEM